jgi:hypothetical protein
MYDNFSDVGPSEGYSGFDPVAASTPTGEIRSLVHDMAQQNPNLSGREIHARLSRTRSDIPLDQVVGALSGR